MDDSLARFARHARGGGGLARLGVAAGLAVLALAILWVPWRPGPAGRGGALEAPIALAEAVISGTVSWKGSDQPVAGVQVVLKDQAAGTAVATATTDAQGVYILSPGVGTWTVDVPSTSWYWGYSQLATAFPHGEYHLDFGITPRPPEPSPPVAAPAPAGAPAPGGGGPPPGSAPAGGPGPAGPGKLPPSGQPGPPAGLAGLLALAVSLIGVGAALRRRSRRGAAPEPC
ncbi:MAG TPA: carboxypeptidase regulatory-like domain-containing protein [Chloroflexia bacterium]|nr:carboxypeptidase regulatory-like domain-containing protein [Chloroflexia bacterium]